MTTDGIIESRNTAGDQFGAGRLQELMKNLPEDKDPLESIKGEFKHFTGDKFEDDISLISIKVL